MDVGEIQGSYEITFDEPTNEVAWLWTSEISHFIPKMILLSYLITKKMLNSLITKILPYLDILPQLVFTDLHFDARVNEEHDTFDKFHSHRVEWLVRGDMHEVILCDIQEIISKQMLLGLPTFII